MNRRLLKFFLGFFALAFLLKLMLIENKTKNVDYLVLNASFNKIDGIQVGTPVMISGIEIGNVSEINLKNNYPILILRILKNLKISNDSSISIQTDGLFGNKFLSIEIGGTDQYFKDGDKFSFTEDSILVEELLEKIITLGEKNKKGNL
ncbi:MAG: putative phospholipid ABC transporter-binding protein MlaD [Alphaproteobacteria bacterium MarineAlpha8_Bin1]|nr:MAG: putative phospholipid ABC transporter-binding protein MlaD [Alphaproteobacteria bacterium MarineAlpha8_Bin1]|tara:strand:+ start:6105 stop:6551 length:447 start_codon:yes stop_codon:yes gene_type:complete